MYCLLYNLLYDDFSETFYSAHEIIHLLHSAYDKHFNEQIHSAEHYETMLGSVWVLCELIRILTSINCRSCRVTLEVSQRSLRLNNTWLQNTLKWPQLLRVFSSFFQQFLESFIGQAQGECWLLF